MSRSAVGEQMKALVLAGGFPQIELIKLYCTTVWVMLGLVAMYMNGEIALTSKKKK